MFKTAGVLIAASLLCAGIANAQRSLPDDQSRRIVEAIGKNDPNALLQSISDKDGLDTRLSSGDTPLAVAAALGSKPIIDLLLERGADVNAVSGRGWTALMVAIFYGNRDIAEALLSHGAKTDLLGEDGATARSLADWRGDKEFAALMPPAGPREPDVRDLVAAISTGDDQAVDRLLALGVRPTASDESGNPVIVIAAAAGDLGALDRLLKAGAVADEAGSKGVTALMVAVQEGRAEIVSRLLESGADPSVHPTKGASAIAIADALGKADLSAMLRAKAGHLLTDEGSLDLLATAAAADDTEKVAKLTADGVPSNGGVVRGQSVIPLAIAAFRGSTATVKLLLGTMVAVDETDDNAATPLMAAIAGNHPEIATLLIDHGASVVIRNKSGLTPVDMARAAGWTSLGTLDLFTPAEFADALKRGDVPTVQAFIANQKDNTRLETADDRGWYPLMYAADSGNPQFVSLLLSRKVALEPPGSGYHIPSPLMIAAANGKLDVVELLLTSGADPNLKDGAGHTAQDMAKKKSFHDVALRLQTGEKTYSKRLNSALAALGFLDKADDTWGDRNRKALDAFYSAFPDFRFESDTTSLASALLATRRACNATTATVFLALVPDPGLPARAFQLVNGWYQIAPGRCRWLQKFALDGHSGPEPIWAFAKAGDRRWMGDHPLCVVDDAMKGRPSLVGSQCEKGEEAAKFFTIDSNSENPIVFRYGK